MKKYFYMAVGVVVCAALLLVGYGAYLNYSSEKNISQMLAGRKLQLEGAYVTNQRVQGHYTADSMRLEAENSADVVARNTGMLDTVYVKEGEKVHKNQLLAKVTSEEVAMNIAQLEAQLSKAQTTLNRYQVSYERYGRLIDKGAISLEQYDEVKANYLGAQAEVKSLQAQKQQYELQRERLSIMSPLEGTVIMLYKKPGSYLNAGTPIALVGDFSTLVYKEELADNRMTALQPLSQIWTLKFSKTDLQRLYNNNYKAHNMGYDEEFSAKVLRIEPPLTVAAAMRTVYWQIDNSSGMLEPRSYQHVKFTASDVHTGLVVPLTAVKKNNSVWVWNQKKQLEERAVVLGPYTVEGVEVLSGVKEGEIVIVSDTTGLTPGSKVDVHLKDGM